MNWAEFILTGIVLVFVGLYGLIWICYKCGLLDKDKKNKK